MSIIKSLSVGNGDMFYIRHGNDNFTIIDCCLPDDRREELLSELRSASQGKGVRRLISTHPDEDHILGLDALDDDGPIINFYCVANRASKLSVTSAFARYKALRDGEKAFHIYKGCSRKWMNKSDNERGTAGISVLWPDVDDARYRYALADAAKGVAFNNMCPVIRYKRADGASFMWIGDLEKDFMNSIYDSIELEKTTVVFAPHHGRDSGKIPDSWLRQLDPQLIVIGEAPSRHLNYYTGYTTITQNRAGDITFDAVDNKVHIYASSAAYGSRFDDFDNEHQTKFDGYVGTLTVETEYTL